VQFDLQERAAGKHAGSGVALGECAFLGYVNLRGDASDPGFLGAVETALGLGLPVKANTAAQGNGLVACWLGPDEWLIVTPPAKETGLVETLRSALGETFAAGHTLITVGGDQARPLLETGCTLDLHPRAFGPGQCAQTLVAKAGVLIRQRDETPLFELVVRRSFAEYLWRWLEHAAREFGMTVVAPELPVHEMERAETARAANGQAGG
jgi:sarcosine oxidase subunit gamma